jgi:uncharacterized integral membrane protein
VSRIAGVAGVVLLLVLVMGFASLNGTERVTLRLGFMTLYRFPLSGVAFGALLLGMIIMFVSGIQADLRVRRILRERLRADAEEEREPGPAVDRAQQDLFDGAG